ncbi:disease resistance protein (TIR-NBS-LRR class) family [Actinidia rufa]|uniref:Disease resistance protein (TIR-NBS-LRR class) family n=1 Tax=Actinidia rufa TaxID=165716 RepID=A0A7J0F6R4_9ERIC|nr:disease resistance protein (TIR-NBS-LRR class) family [Actinidia rufa]
MDAGSTYQVFFSFRGKDIRKTFIDHFYTALLHAGIHTFRDDDDGIERGENIELELKKAIEQSRMSAVVLSEGYASSKHKSTSGHFVLPVFYNVDPTRVRNQTGSFAEAFSFSEEKFRKETDDREKQWMEKVEGWRAALKEVAELGGMIQQNQKNGHEAKFIQEIVKAIDGATDVGVMVLYGMGGVGKTTIAKVVYHLNFNRFEGSSYVPNVRETSEQPHGVIRLQKLILFDLIKGNKRRIYSMDEGTSEIRNAICCKRVIVILDDVDHVDQLHALIGKREWLCSGTLQVLGSFLCGKSTDTWESALQKLKAIPDTGIQNILNISYDSMRDDHGRNLFLDIACFFIGKDKGYTIDILDKCDFYSTIGIQNLIDRSLLAIDEHNKLTMHPLLRDMGREIVRRKSPKEPGKRSRIWHHKVAYDILREETIRNFLLLEGFILNLDNLEMDNKTRTTQNSSVEVFGTSLLKRLRLLQLDYVNLTGDFKEFPKRLRWLRWHGFPLKSIPNNLHLWDLVDLDMQNSNLEQLWKGTKLLKSLKFLNLSHSERLTTTPDFSGLCEGCKNLTKLPRQIGVLTSLQKLILSDCSKLDKLPEELGRMKSLKVLCADRIAIKQLNSSPGPGLFHFMESLSLKPIGFSLAFFLSSLSLDLSGNPICSLPERIKCLTMLQTLHLDRCKNLQSLPELPASLVDLLAKHCTSLERIENLPNLLTSLYLEIFGCKELVEIQGSKVPGWFSHQILGSSISFDLPQLRNRKIQGLNLCIVYAFHKSKGYNNAWIDSVGFESLDCEFASASDKMHYAIITNKTKGLKWISSPTFYGLPESDGVMLWKVESTSCTGKKKALHQLM